MRRITKLAILLAAAFRAHAADASNPFQALQFLEGTWEAKSAGNANGATAQGSYTFARELGGHVLARHSVTAGCKGPDTFDCEHRDLLYIYSENDGQPITAIYFDSEGHVLHYIVTTPAPSSVVLQTDPAAPGPQFRLTYDLKGAVMYGRFQMKPPGQTEWKSYLEWSGAKK